MIQLLISASSCADPDLSRILGIVQKIISLIQMIAPILLIFVAAHHLVQLVLNPDDKKKWPKLRNSFIAAMVIFFIPMIVDVLMGMLGTNFQVAACWNSAQEVNNDNPVYIDPYDTKKIKGLTDPSEYEKGNPKRNIDASSGTYKSGNMTYNVYLPPNPTTKMPVLMWLHGDGSGGTGSMCNSIGKTANSAGYPAVIICPYSPNLGSKGNPGWFEGGHLEELKNILDEVINKYECDTKNINIGGHSRGAIGTWMMVSKYPNVFHSAAPVSCCSSRGFKPESFKGIKVWAMRGSGAGSGSGNDDIYGSCMKNSVNSVKKYAKEVKYTILPGVTHGGAGSNAISNKEMMKFIFSN